MFYQLPPVGNPVRISGGMSAESLLQEVFSPYTPQYFDSGTSALSAAIIAAIKLKGVEVPEVLLPAYGCPDLVSAAIFAGARPVLVDFEPDRPWMSLEQLSSRISASTVAIVAVNLFGISERLHALKDIARRASALLIEDSAQAFPADRGKSLWVGDLVVISFGRGKPVSLLGGGAVLFRGAELGRLLPEREPRSSSVVRQRLGFWLKAALYNLMLSPYSYWLPQGLPFLHLGETRFYPLTALGSMDPIRIGVLAENVSVYQQRGMRVQSTLSGLMAEWDDAGLEIVDLPAVCHVPPSQRLLRYPLLLDASARDRVYSYLRRKGLGPSRMYPVSLPAIPGLGSYFESEKSYPEAVRFAARILTLPLHEKVTNADICKIMACLSSSGS
jgi:dTDP-4-amino-4,6-dideoxygalactose transaminase